VAIQPRSWISAGARSVLTCICKVGETRADMSRTTSCCPLPWTRPYVFGT
jgi:hypothetical protein